MIKPERPKLENVSNVEFICMSNSELMTVITEAFSMLENCKNEDMVKVLLNHVELLLDIQHERASLRKLMGQ